MEEIEIINGKEYKLVTIRGRSKYISKDGDAFNPFHRKQPATIHMNPDGYPCFGGGIPVHLYVAIAWVDGWFDGAEVDHIDYDRTNYASDNLRWVTHADNIMHSHVDENHYVGKHTGEQNGRATFCAEDICTIKNMFSEGMTTMEVIRKLYPGLNYSERKKYWSKFNKIKTGETWS